MAITQASDFTGKWQIATDQNSINRIQPYIDKYEPIYLARLLGAVLSDDLITDIGGGSSPSDPLLVLIFNPFTKDGSCGELHISEGIKAFLRGAIYWHFMTDGKVSRIRCQDHRSRKRKIQTRLSEWLTLTRVTTMRLIQPRQFNGLSAKTARIIQITTVRNFCIKLCSNGLQNRETGI